jgi:5'-nucleotidase
MTDKVKPLILVTNDDGIFAPGIRHLIKLMKEIGEVVVVAPDKPQSGMGHAITVNDILYCDEVKLDKRETHREYRCSGTPVDCVKIATQEIMGRKPDICVSGINHGSNSSINVIYSGTMSAAVEAGTEGIPAIGFSLLDYSFDADFEPASAEIKKITRQVLKEGLPKGVVLNMNIPKLTAEEIKGIKIGRQANAHWTEAFERRQNPQGQNYYWRSGSFVNQDEGKDTDEAALEEGYCSVVPVQFDLTAYSAIDKLKNWDL